MEAKPEWLKGKWDYNSVLGKAEEYIGRNKEHFTQLKFKNGD